MTTSATPPPLVFPRPHSVAVISWLLIVTSAFGVISFPISLKNPVAHDLMSKSLLPIPVQIGLGCVGLVVSLLGGIFMLRGANWARVLYIGWSAFGAAITFLTSAVRLTALPALAIYGLFVYFLTRPPASAFFKQPGNASVP